MKTPREILFQKHSSAEDKLNALRKEVLKREFAPRELQNSFGAFWLSQLWIHLFQPSRRIWAGLAAVWVAVLVANVAFTDDTASNYASAPSSQPTPEHQMALQEQRELLAELIGYRPREEAAIRPEFVPRPSSQFRPAIRHA